MTEDWRQFDKPKQSKDPYKNIFYCNAQPSCSFVTNICNSKSNAKRHVLTCLGIRYICLMCGLAYTRSSKLNIHLEKYSKTKNVYALMESGYVERVKFSMNYHLRKYSAMLCGILYDLKIKIIWITDPILNLHYFYWEDREDEIVGISVGFSTKIIQ